MWGRGKVRKVGWGPIVEGAQCHQECGLFSVSSGKL